MPQTPQTPSNKTAGWRSPTGSDRAVWKPRKYFSDSPRSLPAPDGLLTGNQRAQSGVVLPAPERLALAFTRFTR